MVAVPIIAGLIISFLFLFVVIWLLLSAYCVLVGTAGLVPSVISRRQSGSPVLIFASSAQILSGIALAFSCVYLIVRVFSLDGNNNGSEPAAAPAGFEWFITVLIISMVVALLASLAGAVLSIVRCVKSRKGRTAPRSLTVAVSLTSVPSALVFLAFTVLVLIAVFSL